MALITRITRLFQADLHAVLDRIEEPDVLLKQGLREMEDELAVGEQRIKQVQHEAEQLARRQADIEQSMPRMDEELDVCFESGQDELARGLIKRKLEKQLMLKNIARRRELLDKTLTEERAILEENRGRFDSMRQKAELLLAEASATQHDATFAVSAGDYNVRDDEVEVALLRERQLRKQRGRTPS
jgi:phage shock protein A